MAEPLQVSDPGWNDAHLQAIAPLQAQQAQNRAEMTSLENGTDFGDAAQARYSQLETENKILDTNIKTMQPPAVTDSGTFEAGDVKAYAIDGAGGQERWDSMSPAEQSRAIDQSAIDYQQVRADDTAYKAVGGGPFGDTMVALRNNPTGIPIGSGKGKRANKKCKTCKKTEEEKKKEDEAAAKAKADADAKAASAKGGGSGSGNGIPKDRVVGSEPVPDGVNRDTPVYRSIRSEEMGEGGKFLGAPQENGSGRYAAWGVSKEDGVGTAMMYDGRPSQTTVGALLDGGAKVEPRGGGIVVVHYPESGLPAGTWKSAFE